MGSRSTRPGQFVALQLVSSVNFIEVPRADAPWINVTFPISLPPPTLRLALIPPFPGWITDPSGLPQDPFSWPSGPRVDRKTFKLTLRLLELALTWLRLAQRIQSSL